IGDKTKIIQSWDAFWESWRSVSELNFYRPVIDIANTIDWLVWGERYAGFHLTNVLLHAACAALLFLVGCEILERAELPHPVGLSAAAATLWGILPAKAESVAWLAGRTDSLQCFGLAALWWSLAALRRARGDPSFRPRPVALAAMVGLLAVSLLAKE